MSKIIIVLIKIKFTKIFLVRLLEVQNCPKVDVRGISILIRTRLDAHHGKRCFQHDETKAFDSNYGMIINSFTSSAYNCKKQRW